MSGDPLVIISDAICLGCGCLCDDITVEVDGDTVTEARRACSIGRSWFMANRVSALAEATIEGRAVSTDEALDRAVTLLTKARAPLVLGLADASVETVRLAVALADHLGALIDLTHADAALPQLQAFQRVGRVTASLGEVRERADTVVFWQCDPVRTHPRHLERYSADSTGRFLNQGRVLLAADTEATATTTLAHHFLKFDAGQSYELLKTLKGLARGKDMDADEPTRSWAEHLKAARYGALFYPTGLGDSAFYEALFSLVRDLNDGRRFAALPLGGPGNSVGAEAVLAWQTGFPTAVDFASGAPRSFPPETSATTRLQRGEVDVVLFVGKIGPLPIDVPSIVVAPDVPPEATVGLVSGTLGIDEGGTVARADGVWLSLRPALPAMRPTAREWLAMLSGRILGERTTP